VREVAREHPLPPLTKRGDRGKQKVMGSPHMLGNIIALAVIAFLESQNDIVSTLKLPIF